MMVALVAQVLLKEQLEHMRGLDPLYPFLSPNRRYIPGIYPSGILTVEHFMDIRMVMLHTIPS